jgi:hypothetical protein
MDGANFQFYKISLFHDCYMYRNKDWFYFVNYGSGSGFLVARSYVKKEEIIYEPDGFPLHSDE